MPRPVGMRLAGRGADPHLTVMNVDLLTPHLPTIAALLGLLLVAGLIRRIPVIGTLFNVALMLGLVVMVALLLDERGRFEPQIGRVMRAFDLQRQEVEGRETRIRMARDGHFWATVDIGGAKRRMLVDSGATVTALSTQSAAASGLAVRDPVFPMLLRTANGTIRAQTATVPELRLGNTVARDLPVVVSGAFGGVDVLGMNYLSRLRSWRVEGNTLILVPHHPQPVTS